ncbi:MAG: hypothetical protein WBL63_14590, partial [Candidatus Acidiferrum sp.]
MHNRQLILLRESVQVFGGEIAKALGNLPAEGRYSSRQGEILIDEVAVWLHDSEHLLERILPIGDVV